MSRRSLVLIGLLLALAGGGVVFLNWLLFTQQGLEFAIAQLSRLPTVKVEVRGARGSIADVGHGWSVRMRAWPGSWRA